MADIQPALSVASPFAGLAMARSATVASMTPVLAASRYVLRADARTARALAISIAVPLPPSINRFEASTSGTVVMQLGPDEWMLLVPGERADDMASKAEAAAKSNGLVFGLIDISHRMAGLELSGPRVEDVLAAGCPLQLEPQRFPVGRATRTLFHKAEIVLRRIASDRFVIDCNCSFLPYLAHHLAETIDAEAVMMTIGTSNALPSR